MPSDVTVIYGGTVTGDIRECSIQQMQGGEEFGAAAFAYLSQSRFARAMRDGDPVETLHSWRIPFGSIAKAPKCPT